MEVVVLPTKKLAKKKVVQEILRARPFREYQISSVKGADEGSAQLRTVGFDMAMDPTRSDQGTVNSGPASNEAHVLHIFVKEIDDSYFANGKDSAVITAVFDSPDLSPVPTDIHIWLSLTNGSFDPPQPLQIVPAGIGLVGPEKLSVVDNTSVMIVFFDAQGNPVAPGKNWSVNLSNARSRTLASTSSGELGAARAMIMKLRRNICSSDS